MKIGAVISPFVDSVYRVPLLSLCCLRLIGLQFRMSLSRQFCGVEILPGKLYNKRKK